MLIVKPPRLGPDRVADAAPRPHEMVDLDPARAINRRGEVRALAGQFAQYAADGVPRARSHVPAARTKERFFASQVTAGGPIVAPWNTRPCRSPSSQILENCADAANSWFRWMGDPGLEPGTSSLSGIPFVPSSPLDSHLIPANRDDGAGGRGLEGTTWWPHRGPMAAVRAHGVVWPGSGHRADDTVRPGRSGGVPLRACMIASRMASLGASSSSITRL
jgi:hypothetical protein